MPSSDILKVSYGDLSGINQQKKRNSLLISLPFLDSDLPVPTGGIGLPPAIQLHHSAKYLHKGVNRYRVL